MGRGRRRAEAAVYAPFGRRDDTGRSRDRLRELGRSGLCLLPSPYRAAHLAGERYGRFWAGILGVLRSRKVRLGIIGVDGIKQQLHQRLAHGETILFSDQLGGDYFDQIRAERLVTKYSRGNPVKRWEVISGRRNEALDTLTYSHAARGLVGVDMERRASDLARVTGSEKPSMVIKSKWLDG